MQICENYKWIKFTSHTIKLLLIVIELRIRKETQVTMVINLIFMSEMLIMKAIYLL